jgi:hypothetical protein
MVKRYRIVWSVVAVLAMIVGAVIGGGFYMLDYSLAPEENRTDTAYCYRHLFENYPETRPWVDSLRRVDALRDTFVVMPESGERHHALYVRKGSSKTALILHGWRNCSVDFLFLARLYEQELGYNVVLPDFHAHGLSEGGMIRMGWLDRKDMLHWLSVFQTDTMVIHGVSMGGATAMMMSGEAMPEGIRSVSFIDDCGYTSVWDEFAGELQKQFGLPKFPLMYATSLLCKLRYGWSFGEASALSQVAKSNHPMLFIHGSDDDFVPTEMVHRLFAAKPSKKVLWIAENAKHAESYVKHKDEYLHRITTFLHDR